MGLFDKIKEPVFIKETSSAQGQLEVLEAMAYDAMPAERTAIEQEIKLVKAGIYGENNIAYELKNSHMPMLILQDLYLRHGEQTAQIDYLIITPQRNFVVECKNMLGNIQINEAGDFIRTTFYGGKFGKFGIYSPITQNRRHLELIKKLRMETKGFLAKPFFEKKFYEVYRSVVVLANPKTVLNTEHAPEEIRRQVIRADQLIEFIRQENRTSGLAKSGDKMMEQLAQFFLEQHQEPEVDYTAKFRKSEEAPSSKAPKTASAPLAKPNRTSPLAETSRSISTASTANATTGANFPEPSSQTESTAKSLSKKDNPPLCPRCGATMVQRQAAKGKNAGNTFWGCSKFPKCFGIINQ